MQNNFLGFNVSIGRKKPESIINTQTKCPFCDRNQIDEIIDQEGNILLITNKFQVFDHAFQTVLIETNQCDSELSEYKPDHLHRLFRFGIEHWLDMVESKKYKSVLFFKNHGPLSGGTIRHPHMQIVGLHHADYTESLDRETFNGIHIAANRGVEFSLSTKPQIGFSEFNIVANDNYSIDQIADYIQIATHYLLNNFSSRLKSYNIFFYLIDGRIKAKVMPRFATSPLYIGYNIRLIPNTLEDTAHQVQQIYFAK